jgi:hypothetical protein
MGAGRMYRKCIKHGRSHKSVVKKKRCRTNVPARLSQNFHGCIKIADCSFLCCPNKASDINSSQIKREQ